MRPGDRDRRDSAIQRLSSLGDGDRLLTPREVAEMFGVRTTTIALWARQGRLPFTATPGAHRRYRLGDVLALLDGDQAVTDESDKQTVEDAVRLYQQGWSIRQVAEKFDTSFGLMRRLLLRNGVRLRPQGANQTEF